jgi:hypothetical protein
VGILELEDAETGRRILVDTWDPKLLKQFAQHGRERSELRRRLFRRNEVDFVELSTALPYDVPLIRFFKERARRMR